MMESDLGIQYTLGNAKYRLTIEEALSVYNLLYNNKNKKNKQKPRGDSQPILPPTDNDAVSVGDKSTKNDVNKNKGKDDNEDILAFHGPKYSGLPDYLLHHPVVGDNDAMDNDDMAMSLVSYYDNNNTLCLHTTTHLINETINDPISVGPVVKEHTTNNDNGEIHVAYNAQMSRITIGKRKSNSVDHHTGKVAPVCKDNNDHSTNVAHVGSGSAAVLVYDHMTDDVP